MRYKVEIVETLSRTIEVVAPNAKTAEEIVRRRYRSGEIILGGDDSVDYEIKSLDEMLES